MLGADLALTAGLARMTTASVTHSCGDCGAAIKTMGAGRLIIFGVGGSVERLFDEGEDVTEDEGPLIAFLIRRA